MNIGGYHIGFAGESQVRDYSAPQKRVWRMIAERIGEEVMRRGHRLVTGGCSGGLTENCVKSAKEWLERKGRGCEQGLRITSIVAKEKPPTVNVGQVLVCDDWSRDQRRVYMTSLMDSLITIAGKTGTRKEAQCAFCSGTPVIPIWGTGRNSIDIQEQIQREFATHPLYEAFIGSDAWVALGRPYDNPEETAGIAVNLAIAMAECKSNLHNRQHTGTRQRQQSCKVFVLMPFDPAFDVVYTAIKLALTIPRVKSYLGHYVNCRREDERLTGMIDASTQKSLREADLLVADLTGNNGNVLLEYGYGIALRKKTIPLNQNPNEIISDLQNLKQLPYNKAELKSELKEGKVPRLSEDLATAIQELMADRQGGAPFQSLASKEQYAQCEALSSNSKFQCIFHDEWHWRTERNLSSCHAGDT